MKTKALMNVCAGAVIVLMAGCGGRIRYPTLYTLEIPPAPARDSGNARQGTVAVRRFQLSPYLREGRIAYRTAPEEIAFYDYHRWAADPAEDVTTAMVDSLRSARAFSLVKRYDGQSNQDYLMSGRLERLEEIDYGGAVRVEARVSAELVNPKSGVTVWTGEADETRQVEARNVNSVVLAMSQALQKDIDRLLANLDDQLPREAEHDEHAQP